MPPTETPTVPGGELGAFLLQFIAIINEILVPLLFALAFFVFLWGIYLYFIQGGANEEQRDKGKQLVIWGFIGFFVMISVWGIINLLLSSFSLNSSARPALPTFDTGGQAAPGGSQAAFPAAGQQMLKAGDSGQAVRDLQGKLGVPQDGIFGPQTEAAVKQYQKDHGLADDGIVGPQTWTSLNAN